MKYDGKDSLGRPKQAYVNKLKSLTDDELLMEAQRFVQLSFYAAYRPQSDYHWMVAACSDEIDRRNKANETYALTPTMRDRGHHEVQR